MKRIILAVILVLVAILSFGGAIPPFTTIFMRTVLDDPDAATARTTLGLGSDDSPVFVKVTATGNEINITTSQTPATSSATGTKGDIAWDSGYFYVCISDNNWKRAAINTWGGVDYLLLETGDFLLLETGDKLYLEN